VTLSDAGKLGTEHMVSETSDLHRVIVVGGGAGGLELVTRLGNKLGRYKRADVTLVDKSRAHLWKPLLHEIGAGSMDLGVHEIDYLAQAHWHHFRYRIGELIGLDRRARAVHLAAHVDDEGQQVTQPRSFHYDTLVIAIGSQSNDFGTPGVREHALSLDTPLDAKRFHSRLVNAYIRGHAQSTPLRPEQLQVAIIGAGATGTELAAELHYTTRQVVAYGLDRIDSTRDIKIYLIEAAGRILPALPERLSNSAAALLKDLGVRVCASSKVAEVTTNGVNLQAANSFRRNLLSGPPALKRPMCSRISMVWRQTASTSWSSHRPCKQPATRTFSSSATARPVPGMANRARTFRPEPRRHTSKRRTPSGRSSDGWRASLSRLGITRISARLCRSVSIRRSEA
jgi:NADH dehydrogenase